MTTDEFENPDSTPLSPHDRPWRHPAELADAERARHLSAPPPLGRRLTAITVVASVISSIAVLIVAIPRGIEEGAFFDTDEPVTTTVAPAKGSGGGTLAILRGQHGTTSALPLGNGLWVVSSEAIARDGSRSLTSKDTTVVKQDPGIGLSIIRVNGGRNVARPDLSRYEERLSADRLGTLVVRDAFRVHDAAPEESLSHSSHEQLVPVNMASEVKGLAVATDALGRVVSVIVRHSHAQWAVTRDAFMSFINQ